jgi:phosphoenolpyruvate carboxykinase (ATP)
MILLDQYKIIDSKIHYNKDPQDLSNITISEGMGNLTSDGTLSVNTGKFTGRSPRDRYIVKDKKTKNKVWWGDINRPFDEVLFSKIEDKLSNYLSENIYM